MRTILIFSPGSAQALTIAYLLQRYLPDASIHGVELPNEQHIRQTVFYDSIVPLDQLGSIRKSSLLIPTGAKSTRLILQSGDAPLGLVTLTQNALRVYDKIWTLAIASDIGIPIPVTWQNLANVTSYPLFYKQSQEWGGGARGIAKHEGDIPLTVRDTLIFQELITGQGTYGVGFLANHGRILTSYVHFERESYPKEGGSAVIIETFSDRRLLDYTQRLILALEYSGWGLVEYKYCPRREDFVFMEVNAKFWASCEFAFRNDPKFLKLLFDIDSKETPVKRMVFVDRAFARGLPFVISHFHTLHGSALKFYPGWLYRKTVALLPSFVRRCRKWMKSW